MAIKSGSELAGLMKKALEVESGFESVAQWEGYVSVADAEMRALLFELISDSDEHRRIVESLLAMVIAGDDSALPLQPRTFSFKGKNDIEVMNEIARVEKLMFNMYTDILSAVQRSDLESFLSDPEDAAVFISQLKSLIEGEAKHMASVARYVRKVDRLR